MDEIELCLRFRAYSGIVSTPADPDRTAIPGRARFARDFDKVAPKRHGTIRIKQISWKFYRTALKMSAAASEPPEADLPDGRSHFITCLNQDVRQLLYFTSRFSVPRVLSEILGIDLERVGQPHRHREEITRKSANKIYHPLTDLVWGNRFLPLLRPAYENTPELAALASQARAEVESAEML